jgi:hypothetical protein
MKRLPVSIGLVVLLCAGSSILTAPAAGRGTILVDSRRKSLKEGLKKSQSFSIQARELVRMNGF